MKKLITLISLISFICSNLFAADIAPSWTPRDLQGTLLYIDPSNTSLMYQEASIPMTASTTDAQRVAFYNDISEANHRLFPSNESNTNAPVLGSDGTVNSYLTFTTNNWYKVENSLHAYRNIHTNKVFSILFKMKCTAGSDGVLMNILDNNNASSATSGIWLTRGTDNKIRLWIAKSSAGTPVVDLTSAATITVADGWQNIIVKCDGTTASIKIGNNAATTGATVAGQAAGSAASFDLWIGFRQNSSGPLLGSLGQFLITKTIVSDADITKFFAYNPVRSSRNVEYVSASYEKWLIPTQVKNLSSWYDFDDSNWNFITTADRSTKVSADSTAIRCIGNKNDPDNIYQRDFTTTSSGVSPLWKVAIQNGRNVGRWDGTDDTAVLTNNIGIISGGATWTQFIVCKNNDSALGSHIMSGTNYIVVVGTAYTNGPPFSYYTYHTANADPTPASDLPNGGEGYNILETVRNGDQITTYGNGADTDTQTNNEKCTYNTMGAPSIANWNLNGDVCEVITYSIPLSATTRARIRNYLKLKWGINNTTLPTYVTQKPSNRIKQFIPVTFVKSDYIPSYALLFGMN